MKIEIIRKNHKKEIIIGVVAFIFIAIVFIVSFAFAKYQTTKNMKIVNGTVNYKVPDFKIMAMYKNDGDNYTEIDTMPESGYTINKERSYCTTDNINKVYNKVYTNEEGKHVITGLEKASKCYIYFDKSLCDSFACRTILANVTLKTDTPDYSKTSCSSGCGESTVGLYKTIDSDGDTYYFRGDVENNYVKFANKYWRIIRINGDGTIRIIYDGSSAHSNGTSTTDSIIASDQCFNTSCKYDNNMYAGFMYANNEIYGLEQTSNVLSHLNNWYLNNLNTYANKIDSNNGFCGDRTSYIISNDKYISGGGTGTTTTYYGAYVRLVKDDTPILNCPNEDLYTIEKSNKGNKALQHPVGLITADEVVLAGATWSTKNSYYYLYNGQNYWTLSPWFYNEGANVFIVHYDGWYNIHRVNNKYGVRPVINLRSDVKLTGTGTMSNPYIVE